MESDTKALKKIIFQMCWHMRGGISLDEMFQLSSNDRDIITTIIDDHIEVTNETRLPYF